MKTNLNAVNEYLFEALESLTNDDLTDEQLDREIKRNTAVQKIAQTIIEGGVLALKAKTLYAEYGEKSILSIPLLDGDKDA